MAVSVTVQCTHCRARRKVEEAEQKMLMATGGLPTCEKCGSVMFAVSAGMTGEW